MDTGYIPRGAVCACPVKSDVQHFHTHSSQMAMQFLILLLRMPMIYMTWSL